MIQAYASRHHHGDSDSWNTGNIASVNRHQHGCTINLCLLYEENYFLSMTRFWIMKFKETLPEKSLKYLKSVVAFANGTGGKIIFGNADKTREVIGFDKEDVFKKMDVIRELIINTVVHRSYLDHGTIQVAVYDNRHSKNYWQSKESRTERTGVYWRSG